MRQDIPKGEVLGGVEEGRKETAPPNPGPKSREPAAMATRGEQNAQRNGDGIRGHIEKIEAEAESSVEKSRALRIRC